MPSLGDLVVNLTANTRQFNAAFATAGSRIASFSRSSMRALTDLRTLIAGAAASSLAGGMIKLAAEAETLTVQMEVLTGSTKDAAKVMADVQRFAASTPFQKLEIAQAARSLLAFGSSAEFVISELRMLGDISAATGTPLGDIAEIFGKARVQGRLFAEDMNQLTGRGIPVIGALADQFNVAESEVKKLVESGQVGFPELQKALESMTQDGGKFAGMMERLSETTAGKFSTMKDNFMALATELGTNFLPAVNDVLEALLELSKSLGNVGDKIKPLRLGAMDMAKDMLKAKNFLEAAATFFNPMSTVQEKADAIEKARRNNAALDPFFAKRANEIRGEDRTEQIGNWRAMQIEFHELGRQMAGGISMGWQQGVRNPDAQELAMLYDNAMSMTAMFNAFTPNPSAGKALKNAMLTDAGGAFQGGLGFGFASPLFAMATNPAFLSGATDQLQFAGAAEKGSSSAFDTILAAMRGGTKSAEAQGIDKLNMTVKKEVGEPLKKLANADAGFIVVEDLNA